MLNWLLRVIGKSSTELEPLGQASLIELEQEAEELLADMVKLEDSTKEDEYYTLDKGTRWLIVEHLAAMKEHYHALLARIGRFL